MTVLIEDHGLPLISIGEPRRHRMTVEPTKSTTEWLDMLIREAEERGRAAALREVAERIERLREFETIDARHAKERAWNRAIDRVLAILTEATADMGAPSHVLGASE